MGVLAQPPLPGEMDLVPKIFPTGVLTGTLTTLSENLQRKELYAVRG